MNWKTKSMFVLIAFLVWAVSINGIYAYLTDKKNKQFKITPVENVIEVKESFVPTKLEDGESKTQTKCVQIQNTGNSACYVRVYAEPSETENVKVFVSGKEYSNYNWLKNTDWVRDGNYFYYKKMLKPMSITPALFNQLVIKQIDQAYAVEKFQMLVYAESVQAKDCAGSVLDYQTAWKYYDKK